MTAALSLDAVTMTIRRATLVDRVSLSVQRGETVAIVGPNGAGKSTLMRLLSGDLRPTTGAVQIKGRDLQSYSSAELAMQRAMLSQHVSISFPFTVEEVVRMGAGEMAQTHAQPLVDAMLKEVGLEAFRDRELPTLSGGEQQRAHFARVLLQLACGESRNGPGILLLDEPTSSLDLRYQINLVEMAKRRAGNGTAVVAILHDLNLAARFADRIVVIHQGQIAANGSPGETITAEMLRTVFGVDTEIGGTSNMPTVLPQAMKTLTQ